MSQDLLKPIRSIIDICRKAGAPLSEQQEMLIAGAAAAWLSAGVPYALASDLAHSIVEERKKADKDYLLYGESFTIGGKRIDPATVTLRMRERPLESKQKSVAWRLPIEHSTFVNGLPTQETIDYWRGLGVELEYAYIQAPPVETSQAVRDVLTERQHQIQIGYDAAHDDEHVNDEIAAVAAFYLMPPAVRDWPAVETGYGKTWGKAIIPEGWHADGIQPRRHQLVMGVAMGLAEIERMDRAEGESNA